MKTAIYPGSFDPVTLGHLNIIKRAAACFDRLIVCVMINSKKQGMFTPEERVELLKKATARFPNVEVDYSEGLLAAYAKRRRAHVVVKGLRAVSDRSGDHVPGLQREIYIPELHHRQGDGPVRGRSGRVPSQGDRGRCEPADAGIAGKEGLTMASGVEELLDMLFDMVDEAKNVPLSSDRCMIERDRALDLIDDIRAQFPVELSEAKKVMASRADLIASAKREVEAIRRQAEEKAKQVLSEETILLQAKQRANELMQQAEDRSRELKRSANEYCEDALRRTEEAVAEAYNEIKQSRARFRAAASSTAGGQTSSGGRLMYDAAADED